MIFDHPSQEKKIFFAYVFDFVDIFAWAKNSQCHWNRCHMNLWSCHWHFFMTFWGNQIFKKSIGDHCYTGTTKFLKRDNLRLNLNLMCKYRFVCEIKVIGIKNQCCGSKYIEFGSGSRILAQFGSGSRSGSGSRVILLILKEKIKNNVDKNNFRLKLFTF